MAISFACAVSHAPGITAWRDAAATEQGEPIYAAFARLRDELEAARLDSLIVFSSEHWTNFFLNHMSAFCIGRSESYGGPSEPWLKIDRSEVSGDGDLAAQIIEACYGQKIEPSFSYEMNFDHGTWLPLHFLTPKFDVPIVPVMINTLAPPQPSAQRCFELGQIIGQVARTSEKRIGIVATGGMSHDPGEIGHGWIDQDFDRRFLSEMRDADLRKLTAYKSADFAAAGAGAFELLAWIAAAGALQSYRGEILAYQAVVPWATGIGLMSLEPLPA